MWINYRHFIVCVPSKLLRHVLCSPTVRSFFAQNKYEKRKKDRKKWMNNLVGYEKYFKPWRWWYFLTNTFWLAYLTFTELLGAFSLPKTSRLIINQCAALHACSNQPSLDHNEQLWALCSSGRAQENPGRPGGPTATWGPTAISCLTPSSPGPHTAGKMRLVQPAKIRVIPPDNRRIKAWQTTLSSKALGTTIKEKGWSPISLAVSKAEWKPTFMNRSESIFSTPFQHWSCSHNTKWGKLF